MTTDQFPREQYQTQAPIGAASAGLAASIALGRLLRMFPYADIASIRFEIEPAGASAHWYVDPDTPYVVCSAAEPDECPSCHTIAGQHPHTDYCRRTAELAHRADLWPGETSLDEVIRADLDPGEICIVNELGQMEPLGQASQPATRTSQPPTQRRQFPPGHPVGYRSEPGPHHADDCPRQASAEGDCVCGREGDRESTPLATPTPGICPGCMHTAHQGECPVCYHRAG